MIQQINAAKSGNQMAFTYLWNFYWNYVYGFILKRTNNPEFAKEITNETFIKAFTKINTYKSEYEFKTWLIAVAKNVHFNLNKKKYYTFIEITDCYKYIADSTPSAEDLLIIMENNQLFVESFKQIKPHFQEVLTLRDEGMSYKEIANKTGDSMSNVKVKLSRAKDELSYLIQKQSR
jgi:RNA polymerase sigma factor (sigma-70 family)